MKISEKDGKKIVTFKDANEGRTFRMAFYGLYSFRASPSDMRKILQIMRGK